MDLLPSADTMMFLKAIPLHCSPSPYPRKHRYTFTDAHIQAQQYITTLMET